MRIWLALVVACGGCQCNPQGGGDAGVDGGGGASIVDAVLAARAALAQGATQVDLDGDGRKELTRVVDGSGRTTHVEIDVNGDGRADLVWEYAASPASYWGDYNFDGNPEETMSAAANAGLTDVVHTRFALDASLPHQRRTFSIDPAADTYDVTVEEDVAHDGNYSASATITTARVQRASYPIVFTGGASACDGAQVAQIQAAFDSALADGYKCLADVDKAMAARLLDTVALAKAVTIGCDPGPSTDCASADTDPSMALGGDVTVSITLFPNAFTGCPPSLASTIFHELMHFVLTPGGSHDTDTPSTDPQDQVSACEAMCFTSAARVGTSRTCAACLQTYNGDPRCQNKLQTPCPPAPMLQCAYCPCDDPGKANNARWFPTMNDCSVACPDGLKCFGALCIPRPLAPCCN